MNQDYDESQINTVVEAVLNGVAPETTATIVGLSGDLGAGKTTLVKALAKKLGVVETVVSPTFVIAKFYDTKAPWKQLVHIDAYRIEDPRELEILGWKNIVAAPETLVVVEWPERVEAILPSSTRRYQIDHTEMGRHITHHA